MFGPKRVGAGFDEQVERRASTNRYPIKEQCRFCGKDGDAKPADVLQALVQLLLGVGAAALFPNRDMRQVEAEVARGVSVATQLDLHLGETRSDGGVLPKVPRFLKSVPRAFEVVLRVAFHGRPNDLRDDLFRLADVSGLPQSSSAVE